MTALRELAPVIPIRRMGRPSEADNLRLELAARRDEELDMNRLASALVRRMRFFAHESGRAAEATVNPLGYLLPRHAARWDDSDGAA